ncbi:MAG: hypothetical protein MUF05_00215 [Candidatus Omnitrophica bacterium]|jgi:hypothetical protein|nr:hypothetical protein [Candidatus Omnitrophota bacterium]
MDNEVIVNLFKVFQISLSFFILIGGSFFLLLRAEDYERLESRLSKEVGGIRKISFPALEKNVYVFHHWLLRHKIIFAAVCVLCGLGILIFFWNS